MIQAQRRPRRTAIPAPTVDLNQFNEQIERAITAFGQDVTYSVLIARSAVTIARKRDVWQARRDAA